MYIGNNKYVHLEGRKGTVEECKTNPRVLIVIDGKVVPEPTVEQEIRKYLLEDKNFSPEWVTINMDNIYPYVHIGLPVCNNEWSLGVFHAAERFLKNHPKAYIVHDLQDKGRYLSIHLGNLKYE